MGLHSHYRWWVCQVCGRHVANTVDISPPACWSLFYERDSEGEHRYYCTGKFRRWTEEDGDDHPPKERPKYA